MAYDPQHDIDTKQLAELKDIVQKYTPKYESAKQKLEVETNPELQANLTEQVTLSESILNKAHDEINAIEKRMQERADVQSKEDTKQETRQRWKDLASSVTPTMPSMKPIDLAEGAVNKVKNYRENRKKNKATKSTNATSNNQTYPDQNENKEAWLFNWTGFWVYLAFFIHMYDALVLRFPGGAAYDGARLFIWLVYAYAINVLYYKKKWENAGPIFGISIIQWILVFLFHVPVLGPALQNMTGIGGLTYVILLAALPIWCYKLLYENKSPRAPYYAAYAVIFLLSLYIFVIVLLRLISVLPGVGEGVQANIGQSIDRLRVGIGDTWANIGEVFAPLSIGGWDNIRQRLNQTFNPKLAVYGGQVEDNQQPQGVFIENVNSLYPRTPIGEQPIIFGKLRARSILDRVVKATPSCRLERGSKTVEHTVEIEPKTPLDLQYYLPRDVTCTFNLEGEVDPGTYTGVLGASFDFETWSYVTYTFVSRDLILQYLRNERDLNRDLDIEKTSRAIYTNGPVEIGMVALDMPIDIDPDDANNNFIKQNFGFTIKNRWSQGSIQQVYQVNALMPEQFLIEDCKPRPPNNMEVVDTMRNYTWNLEDLELDPVLDLSTITCKLTVRDQQAAENILAFGEKVPTTFVVMARYKYQVEQKVPVRMIE